MIRLALTKGRIEKEAVRILEAAGYDIRELKEKGRKLLFQIGVGEERVEVVLAKSADVITYIEHGVCDIGVVGADTLMEYGGLFYEILDLGFGKCRFSLAGIKGEDFYQGYGHKMIATKYPAVTKKYFNKKGMDVEIVKIEGSVELAPILGLADAIVDIVETGSTLKENGLAVYEDIADISARLIVNVAAIKMKKEEIDRFVGRVEAVVTKGEKDNA
ncbi:MAG: ATP phosphoribosyltransferase [Christensenellaceae bacterium]|jgi:ATP phosphoribosyltransferase